MDRERFFFLGDGLGGEESLSSSIAALSVSLEERLREDLLAVAGVPDMDEDRFLGVAAAREGDSEEKSSWSSLTGRRSRRGRPVPGAAVRSGRAAFARAGSRGTSR